MKLEKGKAVINEPFWRHPDNEGEIIMDKRYVDLDEILLALPKEAGKIIRDWPAADVRPVVRGKWINQGADSEICSACGSRFYISALFAVGINDEPNFCPNCGADMRGNNE